MHNRLKTIFFVGFISFGMSVSAHALSVRIPSHDWRVSTENYTYGVVSWGSTSRVYYGPGSFVIPLSFWPTLVLLFVPPIAVTGVIIAVARRGRGEKDA